MSNKINKKIGSSAVNIAGSHAPNVVKTTTIEGSASYWVTSNQQFNVQFVPDFSIPDLVPAYHKSAWVQQLSTGELYVGTKSQQRSQATTIKKFSHSVASKGVNGKIYFTFQMDGSESEGGNIADALVAEANKAANAIRNYQLKH